jgi:hypothetical protein
MWSQVFPGGRGHREALWGAYTAGELVPQLRRPTIFGCARGTMRRNDLGICLELQARPGGHIGRCWNIQGGGETDSLPRPVDVSCEVGEWAVLRYPLPRLMGRRQVHGRSVRCEISSGDGKEGRLSTCHRRGLVVSCCWTPGSDEHNPCRMGRRGGLRHRKASRVLIVGYGLYPGDDSAGASSNGK